MTKTYQEERAEQDRQRARRARKFRYEPVMFDKLNPPKYPDGQPLLTGQLVIKTQPYGTPKNGTMGMTYIADAQTGEFIGMVMLNSLRPAERGATND